MIRIAWSNLRSSSGRLFAAMIAIAVSVAFIVAALLFSQAFGDTLRNQVRAEWSGADVAVTETEASDPADVADGSASLDESLTKTVSAVDGASSAQLTQTGYVSVSSDSAEVTGRVTNLPQGQDEVLKGSEPSADDELMLGEADAKTLGVSVGDELSLSDFDGSGRGGDE